VIPLHSRVDFKVKELRWQKSPKMLLFLKRLIKGKHGEMREEEGYAVRVASKSLGFNAETNAMRRNNRRGS